MIENGAMAKLESTEQRFGWTPVWKSLLGVAGLGLVLVAMLYIKVTLNSQDALRVGDGAYADGEIKTAIIHYERAIKWYTPWSVVVPRALERLWQLGTEAEARGDLPRALEAYQALRSSLYAVQSLYIPYQDWVTKSEERIAPLLAQTKAGTAVEADKLKQDTARFARQLQRHVGPHVGWAILVEVSFVSWIGATVGLIWYVFDDKGHFVPRQGFLWGGLVVLFFALWLIGMRLA